LRQCVDHPLLVLGKGANEEEETDQLLDADGTDGDKSLKQMIAAYAGQPKVENGDTESDSTYAQKVLKELGESEQESECFLCTGEIFDEVLLPCYHRGYV